MLVKRGGTVDYVLQWILADQNKGGKQSDFDLEGAWIDPEAQTFMRVSYGSDFSLFRTVIDGMLAFDVYDLPKNFRSSIGRTMMDQWEMLTSQQAYGPNSYFYVMEPTRLYTEKFVESPLAWPAWYCLDYVFARSTATESGSITSSTSMRELLLHSSSADLFTSYFKDITGPAVSQIFPEFKDGGSHEAKRATRYLLRFACEFNDPICLEGANDNFNKVRSGQMTWDDLNVNFRDFSRNYGVRGGGLDEITWLKSLLSTVSSSEQRNYIKALSYMKSEFADEAISLFNDCSKDGSYDDFKYALMQFSERQFMRDVVWSYTKENMKTVVDGLGNSNAFYDFITKSCQFVTSKSDFATIIEIEDIYKQETGNSNKGFQKCAETFAINEHWYDLNGSQMVYWIRNFAK